MVVVSVMWWGSEGFTLKGERHAPAHDMKECSRFNLLGPGRCGKDFEGVI